MERVERDVDAEVDGSTLSELVPASEGKTFWTPPVASDLPTEPAAPETAPDSRRVMQELRAFHLRGHHPADGAASTRPLPALLHPWRDITRVRHEFPVVLDGDGSAARPLSTIIDELIAGAAAAGDSGEQARHTLLRVEAVIRSLTNGDGDRLSLVWDRAVATLFETSRLSDEKAAATREVLSRARKALKTDGELLSCRPGTPARIFSHCASASWTERCSAWRVELDVLIRGMDNILAADFDHSEAAMQPEHLRDTLGAGDDMDVQAMSSLLRDAPHAPGIPEQRRKRVADTIALLKGMKAVFAADLKSRTRAPVHPDAVFESIAEGRGEHARRLDVMTAFFRAVRIARLEIQNQYRDAVHDDYFATFDAHRLTMDEIALLPPVLVRVGDDTLMQSGAGELLDALESSACMKFLVEVHNLYCVTNEAGRAEISPAWPVHLAGMAMSLQSAYVLQAPASRAVFVQEHMLAGMRTAGAALFCVGAPSPGSNEPGTYLAAAAATESRMLPVLVFDPARGATLAERIDVTANAQLQRTWPAESFRYQSTAGGEKSSDVAFTPADFMFCDQRLAGHFWIVPAAQWHDAMLPLHELLELPVNEAAGRIPYIVTVDHDNRVGRAALSRDVVEQARRFRAYWLGMRETGGIENSFAARALQEQRDKLVAEKEREVEAIEKNYVSQLEQDVGELAREIVQRIAAQLMGVDGGAAVVMPVPLSAPAPRAPAPAGEKPAPEAAAPEPAPDEDIVVVTDAYIDTPLCTSCNECTQLNARIFAYNANKQAEVKDAGAGPFSDIVRAAELCPVHIIHPGKPQNPSEQGLDELVKRAERYN